ncbi:hypothetical protein U14_02768 [Candidatus Moduliflexus flocculans]|uniref:Lysozyme inhibitor LprI-like N-terminal domain-containing protein n=1 Tax=Candidatus Moduliflexus flocculans TaxID=1499966 RepID=A0A081BMA7_9BACT|nr:hypothetical protein U14_02768 [Candidatus Moduliflexus flocculans]
MIRTTIKFLIAGAISLLALGSSEYARAASFNCEKAATEIEKAICGNNALSDLDSEVGNTYKTLRSGLSAEQAEQLKREQTRWLQQRNADCANADATCLSAMYQARLADLQSRLPAETVTIHLTHQLHADMPPLFLTLTLKADDVDTNFWNVTAIDIRDKENAPPLQTLEGGTIQILDDIKTVTDWTDRWIGVEWNDLNFDGYDDLLIALSQGMANTWYRVLFYQPASKRFTQNTGLDAENGVPDPEVIPEKQQLVTSSRSSAVGYFSSFYQFDATRGQYQLFREEETGYDEQTDKVMLTIREQVNGQMQTIDRQEVHPE